MKQSDKQVGTQDVREHKHPAQGDQSYPTGMEKERKAPAGGDAKPGPRNPKPLEQD